MTALNRPTWRAHTLYLAWLTVTLATLALYFAGVPDKFAWFAVMPLASLVPILGVAAYFGDLRVRALALPILAAGLVLAAYRAVMGAPPTMIEPRVLGLPFALFALLALLVTTAFVWATPATPARLARPSLPLVLAALVATVATLGSLYFSEVRQFVPCILCWYQRAAMYPLALLLGVAAVRGEEGVRRFALPLAASGWLVAAYHVAEEKFGFAPLGQCRVVGGVSCTTEWVNYFGFVTIPVLSLSAFSLLLVLLAWRRRT